MSINKIRQTLVNFRLCCIYFGWTINGKNNTETNFVVGVTMARVYVTEERNIY